jgi:serine/threonine-protein kinase
MLGRMISHFEVIEKLGEGGMGVVYKARDTHLDRFVALKLLRPDAVSDPERRRRFVQEAKSASALNHPNIMHIYDIDESDGSLFIAMEYVNGLTLERAIQEGGLRLQENLRWAAQIADGLAAAHAAGIVHRDLKPSNIMVTPQGLVKILDFGLAKLMEPAVNESQETATVHAHKGTAEGVVIGTAAYMSPEQAEGRKVDARSDVFSFGAVLYELMTGQQAFRGSTRMATISSVIRDEPAAISSISPGTPAELDRMVQRCMRKDPERRAQNMADIKVQLEEIREETASGIRPPPIAQPPEAPRSRVSKKAVWSAAALLLIVGIAAAVWWRVSQQRGQKIDSLAVLPFVNVGGEPNTEYLSDGITESIINNLSQLPSVRVMARSTVFRYKGRDNDPQKAGKELGVRAVLAGRLLQRGDTLTVDAELVDVETGTQLWGSQYRQKLADLLNVQESISNEIAGKLQVRLAGAGAVASAHRPTSNPEAYRLYLEGMYQSRKYTREGVQKGFESFQKAIALDPNYALAYTGIAFGSAVAEDWMFPPRDIMPRAKEAVDKALAIDSNLGLAHSMKGYIAFFYDYDIALAEREMKRGVELDPNDEDGHGFYSWFLVATKRFDEGIAEAERGRQAIPFGVDSNFFLSQQLYFAHRYDQSILQSQSSMKFLGDIWFEHEILGWAYEAKGDLTRAIGEIELARKEEPTIAEPLASLGHAYALAGRKDEARKVIEELREMSKKYHVPPYTVALVYSALNEKEAAFAELEKAWGERSWYLIDLAVDPQIDNLRDDPRFKDLLRRVGLPQ